MATGRQATADGNIHPGSQCCSLKWICINKFTRWIMYLPDLPKKGKDIKEQHKEIWSPLDEELKVEKDFEKCLRVKDEKRWIDQNNIKEGIPTEAMTKVANATMKWNRVVQAGMCSASFANEKFILQLNNSAVVSSLLSGFATTAVVASSPDFTHNIVYSDPIPKVFQGCYSALMFLSALCCFAATVISLHSVNRISNVLPSKSSVAYMAVKVFFHARESVSIYTFRGMWSACGGIISIAIVWSNQSIYYGIPALIVSVMGTLWFIALYDQWKRMAEIHSDVADKLCAFDMKIIMDRNEPITEGLCV